MNKFEYKKLAQLAVRENAELACENKALRRELAVYEDAIYPTPPVPEDRCDNYRKELKAMTEVLRERTAEVDALVSAIGVTDE